MKPSIKNIEKWVAALRSGEYKQTRYRLNDSEGMCCLGVACDVFIPKNKIKKDVNGNMYGGVVAEQPSAPIWLKKVSDNFHDYVKAYPQSLNDHKDMTFDEIADILEAVYIHQVLEK